MRVDLAAPPWATHLLSDLTDWQRAPVPVDRLEPFELPDDAYFEYAWLDRDGRRCEDPANPHPRLNPWWPYACHLTGPAYRADPDAQAGAGVAPAGRTLRLEVASPTPGRRRHVLVYTPAGCGDRPLPAILFQDGKAYQGWGRVPQVLDRLLGRGEVAPAHLVFVPPVERTPEYFFNPTYRRFLLEEALPAVAGRVAIAGPLVAWGASLGGLLSAQLAWEAPGRFRAVVAQSGAFLFSPDTTPGDPFHGRETFADLVVKSPQQHLAFHLECGALEWLLPSNRRLAEVLRLGGHRVTLVERAAGHNWVSWRNGIAAGLRFALGPGSGAGAS
ncbi:esterase family protein [bacterium]|nr:esterase family protein [bacterium]